MGSGVFLIIQMIILQDFVQVGVAWAPHAGMLLHPDPVPPGRHLPGGSDQNTRAHTRLLVEESGRGQGIRCANHAPHSVLARV